MSVFTRRALGAVALLAGFCSASAQAEFPWFGSQVYQGTQLLSSSLDQADDMPVVWVGGRRNGCYNGGCNNNCSPDCNPNYGYYQGSDMTAPSPDGQQPSADGQQYNTDMQPSQQGQQNTQGVDRANLGGEQYAATGTGSFSANSSQTGYLDNPIVGRWFRVRYDAAYDNEAPDRAEYFYGRCGGPGPQLQEKRVDYQDIRTYLELPMADRFSVFAELPVRFLNPTVNDNTAGFADMNVGCKWAICVNQCSYTTAQLRVYCPTGDSDRGLGTNHGSIEPGLLNMTQLGNNYIMQSELKIWIPTGGTDGFAGPVMQYGVGLGKRAYPQCGLFSGMTVTPITEFVGWTVINGRETKQPDPNNPPDPNNLTLVQRDADGATIINAKVGVRFTKGCDSIYTGYGRAITGDAWYRDLFRLEYRRMF